MFTVVLEYERNGRLVKEGFTAQSFYQVIAEGGVPKLRWVAEDGKDKTVTHTRIRAVVEKKV